MNIKKCSGPFKIIFMDFYTPHKHRFRLLISTLGILLLSVHFLTPFLPFSSVNSSSSRAASRRPDERIRFVPRRFESELQRHRLRLRLGRRRRHLQQDGRRTVDVAATAGSARPLRRRRRSQRRGAETRRRPGKDIAVSGRRGSVGNAN